MALESHALSPGDLVDVRGETWLLTAVDPFEGCAVLRLEGRGPGNSGVRFSVIAPFDRPARSSSRALVRRPRAAVLSAALAALADPRPPDGLWAARDARISLLPYQLEPALAVLDGCTRVLLADEVGLGKTIQAGLVLAELVARGLADRALVLTPAGLRHAWANELRTRFGLSALVVDHASIARARPLLPRGANPWLSASIVIASLDFAKRADVVAAIEQTPLDVLIVDEAHHLTPGSDRGAAVARLARRAPWVLLLSATPHSGDESAFTYLTGIGAVNDPLAIFRRTRQDAGPPGRRRRTRLLAVRPCADEAAMLAGAADYARALWHGQGADDPAVRLVAMTIARRAASSARALHRTLARRLAWLAAPPAMAEHQMALPWEDTDAADDDLAPAWLGTRGLADGDDERRRLEALVGLAARAARAPSKIQRLVRLLDRVAEPAVVFTEYRDTLFATADALAPSRRLGVIHGGLQPDEREAAVECFVRGETDVLLATDAAGEGLNLQHRCRLVVTLELPWNPLRLEQRVGRVDRIGQRRRVHALHLYHRGSVEDIVLASLARRRQRMEAWLPGSFASEQEIAAAAIGGARLAGREAPSLPGTEVPRAVREAERLAECRRRWNAHAPQAPGLWTSPRRERTSELVLLFDVRHLGRQMLLLERAAVALKVSLAHAPRAPGEWRRMLAHLGDAPALARALAEEHASRPPALFALMSSRAATLRPRLEQILQDVRAAASRHHQASLFDNRPAQEADHRRRTSARIERHLARRLEQVLPLDASEVVRQVRLLAAFPCLPVSRR